MQEEGPHPPPTARSLPRGACVRCCCVATRERDKKREGPHFLVMSIENTHLRKDKGRYLYDVRTEGRGDNTDEVQSLDSAKGEGWGRYTKKFQTLFKYGPREREAAILR